mgnify:CR=1 FL=1
MNWSKVRICLGCGVDLGPDVRIGVARVVPNRDIADYLAEVAAGATGMAFWPFIGISLIGRAARFFIVAAMSKKRRMPEGGTERTRCET